MSVHLSELNYIKIFLGVLIKYLTITFFLSTYTEIGKYSQLYSSLYLEDRGYMKPISMVILPNVSSHWSTWPVLANTQLR